MSVAVAAPHAAVARNEQRIEGDVDNRRKRGGQERWDGAFFQQIDAFLKARQAVEARAHRQHRDERPADVIAGHGQYRVMASLAHMMPPDAMMNTIEAVGVADIGEELDLLFARVVVNNGDLPCIDKNRSNQCNQCRHAIGNGVNSR